MKGPVVSDLVHFHEQILKQDCGRCRLKTEHYVKMRDGLPLMLCCLRCGQLRKNLNLASGN